MTGAFFILLINFLYFSVYPLQYACQMARRNIFDSRLYDMWSYYQFMADFTDPAASSDFYATRGEDEDRQGRFRTDCAMERLAVELHQYE